MAEYIEKKDAVEAVWRILNGMGYSQKHNDRLVEEVDAVIGEYTAADAIEELSKYVNTIMRLKSEGWYLQQTKNHDGYAAIATMPLPEPPKEE